MDIVIIELIFNLQGTYILTNGTFNVDPISRLPIEGYKWQSESKVFRDTKDKKLILCILSDTVITIARN